MYNNYKKAMCQLCNKTNFPIKQLDGHFYHVTCLLLLNLGIFLFIQPILKVGN